MVIILCGKSGCGKDATLNELCNNYDIERYVTCTTRPMRNGEINHLDYHFLTKEYFLNDLKHDGFIEHRKYDTSVDNKPETWYYGTPKMLLKDNENYVIIVDLDGAKNLINYYGKNNCMVAYISSSDKVREDRAKIRGSFNKTEWDRRAADDAIKFSSENLYKVFDMVGFKNALIIENDKTTNIEDITFEINAFLKHLEKTKNEKKMDFIR